MTPELYAALAPILRREWKLCGMGYSADEARRIAFVSRFVDAFTFGDEYFDWRAPRAD